MRLILTLLFLLHFVGYSQMKYEVEANPSPILIKPFYTEFNSTGVKSFKRYRNSTLIGECHYDKKGRRTLQISHIENQSYSYTKTSYPSSGVVKYKMSTSRDTTNYTILTEKYNTENKPVNSEYLTYRKNKLAYTQNRNWEYLNGKLVTWEFKNQSIQKFYYEKDNLILSTHKTNGALVGFEKKYIYNSQNLPIAIEEYFGEDSSKNKERSYVYQYNDLNQVISETYVSLSKPDKIQVSKYLYSTDGKIKTMMVRYDTDSLRLDIAYDKNNNTTSHFVTTTTLNCAYLKYFYHFDYQAKLDNNGKLNFEKQFSYNSKGNLIGVKTLVNNKVQSNFTYKIEYYN